MQELKELLSSSLFGVNGSVVAWGALVLLVWWLALRILKRQRRRRDGEPLDSHRIISTYFK